MPQTKARDLQLLQVSGFFYVYGNQISMMTKESETEFYGQISGNGILPVISSWALIKQTMRSTAFGKKSWFSWIKTPKISCKSTMSVLHFI